MRLRKGKKLYMTTLMIKGKMKLKIMTIKGKKVLCDNLDDNSKEQTKDSDKKRKKSSTW